MAVEGDITIKEEEIEILFEFKGYRKACKVKHSALCLSIQQQLHFVGEPEATVLVAESELVDSEGSDQSSTFLLQKWSNKWKAFVNVGSVFEILNEDKVTVTRKPVSSPTKVSPPLLFTC